MRPFILVVLLGYCLGSAAQARAEDFTFVVPVQLNNLPAEISSVHISCTALNNVPTAGHAALGIIGVGDTIAPVSGGSFRGDVSVAFNATTREYAGYAESYICSIADLGRGPRDSGRIYYTGRDFIPLNPKEPYVTNTGVQPLR